MCWFHVFFFLCICYSNGYFLRGDGRYPIEKHFSSRRDFKEYRNDYSSEAKDDTTYSDEISSHYKTKPRGRTIDVALRNTDIEPTNNSTKDEVSSKGMQAYIEEKEPTNKNVDDETLSREEEPADNSEPGNGNEVDQQINEENINKNGDRNNEGGDDGDGNELCVEGGCEGGAGGGTESDKDDSAKLYNSNVTLPPEDEHNDGNVQHDYGEYVFAGYVDDVPCRSYAECDARPCEAMRMSRTCQYGYCDCRGFDQEMPCTSYADCSSNPCASFGAKRTCANGFCACK